MPEADKGESSATASVLLVRQSLLTKCLAKLLDYATQRGYMLTLGEGSIQSPRRCRDGVFREDGVHMPDSLHYQRLAQDLNLFVREAGEWAYVTRSDHFAYQDLGAYWVSLDALCRWGGHFQSRDANHFSIAHQGRA